jgi:phage gpG-like protein
MIEADFSQLFAYMNLAIAKLANHEKFYDRVGSLGVAQVKDRIKSTKQDPDGVPWIPRKDNKSHPLLFNTGDLFASINKTVGPNGVTITSDVDYAKYLQLGTSKMPARPFLGWGAQDKESVMVEFAAWVNEALI